MTFFKTPNIYFEVTRERFVIIKVRTTNAIKDGQWPALCAFVSILTRHYFVKRCRVFKD